MSVLPATIAAVTEHQFTAELWRWRGKDDAPGSWFFLSLPHDVADAVDDAAPGSGPGAGFGSVRVEVTIGTSTWRTSLFPSKAEETFVLPVKRTVRDREGLEEGAACGVRLRPL